MSKIATETKARRWSDGLVLLFGLTALVAIVVASWAHIDGPVSTDPVRPTPHAQAHDEGVATRDPVDTGSQRAELPASVPPDPPESISVLTGSLDDLKARHMTPAPLDLQRRAGRLWRQELEYYEAMVERTREVDPPTLDSYLEELHAQFQVLLRRRAVDATKRGAGLLRLGRMDHEHVTAGRHWIEYMGQDKLYGYELNVMVIMDADDRELRAVEESYFHVRYCLVTERATLFNAIPSFEERKKGIESLIHRHELPGFFSRRSYNLVSSFLVIDKERMTLGWGGK